MPAGRGEIVNTVENREAKPLKFGVGVNRKPDALQDIPAGQTVEVVTPIPDGTTDLTIRFRGDKSLVILKSNFR